MNGDFGANVALAIDILPFKGKTIVLFATKG